MIISPSESFYVIRASGDAAELIAAAFSPGTMADITDVIVLSKDFSNDIEPMNEIDETLKMIKDGLGVDLIESVMFNPLFVPRPIEELDDALEVEQKSEIVGFSAMNGNPYAVRTIELGMEDEPPMLSAIVSYHQFDLPSYEIIMKNQLTQRLN